jgi:hypothetical protein
MVVAKWHVRSTSGAPKALVGRVKFLPLAWAGGCPKQASAKIAAPREPVEVSLLARIDLTCRWALIRL